MKSSLVRVGEILALGIASCVPGSADMLKTYFGPSYWGGTGHYYEVVVADGRQFTATLPGEDVPRTGGLGGAYGTPGWRMANEYWSQARIDAEGRSYVGGGGHLVSITSEEENSFVVWCLDQVRNRADINPTGEIYWEFYAGGVQSPLSELVADQGWTWTTGEPWGYTAWGSSEPNDGEGIAQEQWLGIGWGGNTWNDEGELNQIRGYVIEYETSAPDGGASLVLLSFGLGALCMLRSGGPKRIYRFGEGGA